MKAAAVFDYNVISNKKQGHNNINNNNDINNNNNSSPKKCQSNFYRPLPKPI